MPRFISSQNQRANRAPARRDTPTVISTEKATMPTYVFGNPNVMACQDCITRPQDSHGLMSQLVT